MQTGRTCCGVGQATIERWRRLRTLKKERHRLGRCLLTSPCEVEEIARRRPVQHLICRKGWSPPPTWRWERCSWVSEEELQRITGLPHPAGVAAELELPPMADDPGEHFLILDGVADPSNVGMLLRNACVLGCDGVICLPGTADPFNDKALRTSKGAPWFLRCCHWTTEQAQLWVEQHSIPTYVADLTGEAAIRQSGPVALVMGHETRGPGPEWDGWPRVHVVQKGPLDSLNVAAAGAILLSQLLG